LREGVIPKFAKEVVALRDFYQFRKPPTPLPQCPPDHRQADFPRQLFGPSPPEHGKVRRELTVRLID